MSVDEHRPLDTAHRVVTPENIAFDFRLAGPFHRALAYLIDMVVVIAILWAVVIALGLLAGWGGIGLFLVLRFFLTWGYGGVCEALANGQTLGKKAMGIRVVTDAGLPIDGVRATLRNILRDADLLLLGAVAAVSMFATRRFQRLGDLAAGTMVVVDERRIRPLLELKSRAVSAIDEMIPIGFEPNPSLAEALAGYAVRRTELSAGRREELADVLAQPVIARFDLPSDLDPDLLLLTLYDRVCHRRGEEEAPKRRQASGSRNSQAAATKAGATKAGGARSAAKSAPVAGGKGVSR
jgi:uncharacterized RDD family membrane protein YckC